MAKTLEELKAENAAAETEAEQPEAEPAEVETEAVEVESEEPEQVEQPEDGETEEAEVEAWQLEDEQASEGSAAKFGDSDVAAAKRKLRAKLERQHNDELEQLKAEIESLKRGRAPVEQAAPAALPTLEAYDYDEGKYQAAMQAWIQSQLQTATKSQQSEAQRAKAAELQEQAVDAHYQRAVKLTKEHGIDMELYQGADRAVRSAIEAALPGQGDVVTETLIARLGEGSEKVLYSVGRSAEKREKLQAKLLSDPSGLSASMYLGELKGSVTQPVKRTTKAPKPAARAEGGNTGGSAETRLKRKYQSESDMQTRFDIRREAKRAGFDVSNW